MHSMRLSDRTVSFDAGLNLVLQKQRPKLDQELFQEVGAIILPHNGATISGSSRAKKASRPETVVTPDQADDGIGTSDDETHSTNSNSSQEDSAASPNLGQSRRVIKLDLAAMSQLLAFDEEDEEDLESESEEEEKDKPNGVLHHNKEWRKTVAIDFAKLASNEKSSQIRRRHSITLCESRLRKTSSDSTCSSSMASDPATSQRTSPAREDQFTSLNVAAFNHNMAASNNNNNFEVGSQPLKTLDLRLEEVAHIRSVLTKAELEAMAIDSSVRDNISRGKICFHCMKVKFGLFSRGQKCEMCKQTFCNRCHTKMRIPVEHFSTTPVFALSPMGPLESLSRRIELDHSLSSNNNHRKVSLPAGYAMNSSVGSAPNSPKVTPKSSHENLNNRQQPHSLLPTISGFVTNGPTSLPPIMHSNKYATLPTKARRMSLMSARDAQREKLEGSLLTVCVDCKEMVVQVIRVSRTSKRHSRAEFSTITPDNVRELRS